MGYNGFQTKGITEMSSRTISANATSADLAGRAVRAELNKRMIVTGPLTVRVSEDQRDDKFVAIVVPSITPRTTWDVIFDVTHQRETLDPNAPFS